MNYHAGLSCIELKNITSHKCTLPRASEQKIVKICWTEWEYSPWNLPKSYITKTSCLPKEFQGSSWTCLLVTTELSSRKMVGKAWLIKICFAHFSIFLFRIWNWIWFWHKSIIWPHLELLFVSVMCCQVAEDISCLSLPSFSIPTLRHFIKRHAWQDLRLLFVISHSLVAGQLYSMFPANTKSSGH